tara:strand:+ start:407 stop:871 length:465 start_codon:yes stop_codon:yes gene_type:complete
MDSGWLDGQHVRIMNNFEGKFKDGINDISTNYSIDIGNYLFGVLEHTFMNVIKYNNAPMLSSLLILIIGFTVLNVTIGNDISEIRMARGGIIDKIISAFYVTIQLLTFRNLKEPPSSVLAKLLICMQQIIFFLILLFFFQHFAGGFVMRQWMGK